MPTIICKTELETIKKATTYSVSEGCCKQFSQPNPNWAFCPFCGEKIVYQASVVATGEVIENAKI